MPPFLSSIVERSFSAAHAASARIWRSVIGLAQDFWKDGDWSEPSLAAYDEQRRAYEQTPRPLKAGDIWQALPGEIAERMWGQHDIFPGDAPITERLVRPLGLTKDMKLLDLSAGLGGAARKIAHECGVVVAGLESDPDIAARGMTLSVATGHAKQASIAAYDPAQMEPLPDKYDGVLAREILYRIADKQKFIATLMASCQAKAQISFTDYIVNPEAQDHPAIAAWYAAEPDAHPAGLVEMAELWAKAGVDLRVHDDITDYYKNEVKSGLAHFAMFMASGVKPDHETKQAINKQIILWAHRMAAMDHGMKFYRFYGQR